MKKVKFGIIGGGLMGREFAAAAARWCHLLGDIPAPEIVGIASPSEGSRDWFRKIGSVRYFEQDYRELLAKNDIEAVYCAVPHDLHEQIYSDVVRAGKHLMGEKPFGINRAANTAILAELKKHPGVFARCASQLPFFPGCQQILRWFEEGAFGRVIEIKAGFRHSSDMDLQKPINWKRQAKRNGEYGCLGDLGMHTQYVPIRMGFIPTSVYASLSKFVPVRPDGAGGSAVCDTWDNAVLFCWCGGEDAFPMFLETKRMEPGATNEWYLEIHGLTASARFNTNDANAFRYTQRQGREQAWCRLGVGNKPQFPTITGSIFEFGFADAILQMWAAFLCELDGREVFFGCMRPEETAISHAIQTAALESHRAAAAVSPGY
jgi:predicted dehydrogenase